MKERGCDRESEREGGGVLQGKRQFLKRRTLFTHVSELAVNSTDTNYPRLLIKTTHQALRRALWGTQIRTTFSNQDEPKRPVNIDPRWLMVGLGRLIEK